MDSIEFSADTDEDRIPPDILEKLADSDQLKALLCNKNLQQLLLHADRSAGDKASVIETLMKEPIFVEFADQCLTVVAPDGTQGRSDGMEKKVVTVNLCKQCKR